MGFEINRADVWTGVLEDRPGALAEKLEAVQRAGANLDFVIVRPEGDEPRTGVMFLSPLTTPEQEHAAADAGLHKSKSIHALKLVGPDRPGLGAGVARTLADEHINIKGLSAAAVNDQAIVYLRFESDADAWKAAEVLTPKLA